MNTQNTISNNLYDENWDLVEKEKDEIGDDISDNTLPTMHSTNSNEIFDTSIDEEYDDLDTVSKSKCELSWPQTIAITAGLAAVTAAIVFNPHQVLSKSSSISQDVSSNISTVVSSVLKPSKQQLEAEYKAMIIPFRKYAFKHKEPLKWMLDHKKISQFLYDYIVSEKLNDLLKAALSKML